MSQIHQEITLAASPPRIYRALTDSGEFARFTGVDADIRPTEGGSFVCFGTFVLGRIVELIPDRRIVQAWRVFNWPDGIYSIVRFELHDENGNTRLVLDQDGVPDKDISHIDAGWENKYWRPLREHLHR